MYSWTIRIDVETEHKKFAEIGALINSMVASLEGFDETVEIKVDSVYQYEKENKSA